MSRNQEVIGMAMMKTPFRYSDHVIDYIEFLLRHLGIEKEQIGCIAVASGPGSFTGLRIGLAIAKGLAQPLDLPAVGISTLEALAFRFRYVSDRIAPMIDARRQQIYGAVYRVADQEVEAVSEGVVMDPAEWLKGLGGTGDSRLRSSSYGAPRERSQNSEFRSQESAAFALQATARQGKEVRSLVPGKSPEDGLRGKVLRTDLRKILGSETAFLSATEPKCTARRSRHGIRRPGSFRPTTASWRNCAGSGTGGLSAERPDPPSS